ncbi:hypothetical protein ALC152_12190 [Arcobacter sp. 15-2]|uniref:hypothetical protein n=1 Tax=Arcobacter sp. 15-2 TaxID=3374109 RepID=UPI00399CC02A
MGLKKYIFGSLLLAIVIFGYTFSIEAGDYRVQILDFTLILPIALWIVLPMVILLVLTILHISFYGLKNFFIVKAFNKDSNSLITLINKRLLNENSNANFQNENLKELADVLNQLDVDVSNTNFSSQNKDISKTVDQKFNIKAGKYVSSKDLKLDLDNPMMIENIKNRIEIDDNFALEVIKNSTKYSQIIIKKAFLKAVETKSMTSIKKVIPELKLDNDMVKAVLKKDSEQKIEFAMTNEMILELITKATLSNTDLITIAKNYKSLMTPEQLIRLFEDIASAKEEYTTSYLYVLAEYEMIDKIRDILVNNSSDEYLPFRALIDLKDAGKHTYSLDALSYK